MAMADGLGAQSIAFPALGTGNLGMADVDAANALFQGIYEVTNTTNLKQVNVVIFDAPKLSVYKQVQSTRVPPPSSSTPPTNQDLTLANGVSVVVEQGNIVKETSDAIVVPAGIVLQQVHESGGQSLQTEWKTKYNSSVKSPSDFAELSGGGQLKCKKVYVIAPASFNPTVSQPQNESNISTVVERILEAADKASMQWVAIPTIGTGNLGYSNDVSARAIAKGLTAFSSNVKYPNIQRIKVTVFEYERVAVFQHEIKQHCRSGHISSSGGSRAVGEDPEPVSFLVVGESQSACNEAMSDLTELVNELCVERQIMTEVPQYLIDAISKDPALQGMHVKVTLDNERPKLFLAGTKEDVSSAADSLMTGTSQKQEEKRRQMEVADICSKVKWLYENNNKFIPYPSDVIVLLEKAFQKKENRVQLSISSEHRQCSVDLELMQETDQKTRKIRNVQREEFQTRVLEIPKEWERLPCGTDYSYHTVALSPSSSEYKHVSEKFTNTVHVQLTTEARVPPYPSLVSIQRIQNPRIYNKYLDEKEALKKKRETQLNTNRGVLEMELFHVAGQNALEHIISNGFDRSFVDAEVKMEKDYGTGLYFAKNSGYLLRYTSADPYNQHRKMLLCKVLLGLWTKGEKDIPEPPIINPAVSKVDRYDSTVDNSSDPSIFVSCFRDDMVYPAYIITYTHAIKQ
jgi:poly [ADP-ribose] polymerase 10/14/15